MHTSRLLFFLVLLSAALCTQCSDEDGAAVVNSLYEGGGQIYQDGLEKSIKFEGDMALERGKLLGSSIGPGGRNVLYSGFGVESNLGDSIRLRVLAFTCTSELPNDFLPILKEGLNKNTSPSYVSVELLISNTRYTSRLNDSVGVFRVDCSSLSQGDRNAPYMINVEEDVFYESELKFSKAQLEFDGYLYNVNSMDSIELKNFKIEFPLIG